MRGKTKKTTAKRANSKKIIRGLKALRNAVKIVKGAKKSSSSRISSKKSPKPHIRKIASARTKAARAKARAVQKTSFLEDKQIYGYLQNLVGQEGMTVVQQIAQKERSDVDLAEKMDIKANIIRKHLYAMYEAGVVTYKRHRSKTGWYTYYWKLHPERIANAISQNKEQQIKDLMEMLEYEKSNHFYQCKSRCTRVVFDEATDLGFKCMKCNESLEHADNTPFIQDIEKKIAQLRNS